MIDIGLAMAGRAAFIDTLYQVMEFARDEINKDPDGADDRYDEIDTYCYNLLEALGE